MTLSTNPAVIIGLGGTGQWALTYVKNNMLERFGEMPTNVKLLAFDTTGETSEAKIISPNENEEPDARLGQVFLEGGEFVYLGGNVKLLCEQIANSNRHRHIGRWFQAPAYLGLERGQNGLSDDDFNLARGAGLRRQFGRVGIFYDLMRHADNRVFNKITESLIQVNANLDIVSSDTPPTIDVYIVASIAGGTGSGMFIDMALLTRHIAKLENIEVMISGFIVLPSTFHRVLSNTSDVRPQAYAAIREMNRFQTHFADGYPIKYTNSPRQRNLNLYTKSKLFDHCYLLDAERRRRSLKEIEPIHGVFPSIAECITMMLDSSSGQQFHNHYKNVSQKIRTVQQKTGITMYGSLGVYSYILPVNDMLRSFTLRLMNDYLNTHIYPIDDHNKSISLTVKKDVHAFLRQAQSSSGIKNLAFSQFMAGVVKNYKSDNSADVITFVNSVGNLGPKLQPPSDVDIPNQMLRDYDSRLQFKFINNIRTSTQEGDALRDAVLRITGKVESFNNQHFGDKETIILDSDPGDFLRLFNDFYELNQNRLRNLLQEEVQAILNGKELKTPTGRLHAVYLFLTQLSSIIRQFSLLMDASLKRHATERGPIEDAIKDSKTRLEKTGRDRTGFRLPFVKKPTGEIYQIGYLQAEQNLRDYRVRELVLEQLYKIGKRYGEIVSDLLDDVENQIEIWVTGNVAQNIPGLYRIADDKAIQLRKERQEKAKIEVQRYLTDKEYEEKLYQQMSRGKMEDFDQRLEWSCVSNDEKLRIEFALDKVEFQTQNSVGSPPKNIFTILYNALEQYFQDVRRETAAKRLKELYEPEKLANEVLSNSASLIDTLRETKAGTEQESQLFISSNAGVHNEFLAQIENIIQNQIDKVQRIPATDMHRFIAVSTTDLIGVDSIPSIINARQAYDQYQGDKRQIHVFPAEVNATQFESRLGRGPFAMYKFSKPHHFSYRLVSLLEYPERLEKFVLAYVMDVIRQEELPRRLHKSQYILRMKRRDRHDSSFEVPLTKEASYPKLYDAMHSFVFSRYENIYANRQELDLDWLEETIHFREQLVERDLDSPLGKFAFGLRKYRSLNANLAALESEFSYFLLDTLEKYGFDGQPDRDKGWIQDDALDWLQELRTMDSIKPLESRFDEIADLAQQCVSMAFSRDIVPDRSRLKRYYESDIIIDKLYEFRNSRDQEKRDLGMIMHIIIWDYLQRLEQQNVGN
jgi:hypothetical protein